MSAKQERQQANLYKVTQFERDEYATEASSSTDNLH